MLKFQVSGQIIETRELRTSKEKGDRVWRRQWKLAYQGGTVEIGFPADSPEHLALWSSAKAGDEVEVHGHVGQDTRGPSFFYDAHTSPSVEDKALSLLMSHGMTEQQAKSILAKSSADRKGVA